MTHFLLLQLFANEGSLINLGVLMGTSHYNTVLIVMIVMRLCYMLLDLPSNGILIQQFCDQSIVTNSYWIQVFTT